MAVIDRLKEPSSTECPDCSHRTRTVGGTAATKAKRTGKILPLWTSASRFLQGHNGIEDDTECQSWAGEGPDL